MKKDVALVLIILLGIPAILIVNYGTQTTGAIANEIAVLKLQRTLMYHDFPNDVNNKMSVRIRDGIRAGAHQDFYGQGLQSGDRFFDNEKELYKLLLQASCLTPIGGKGWYKTQSGTDILMVNNKYFDTPSEELLNNCDPTLTYASDMVLKKLIMLDYSLILDSIEYSKCPEESTQSLLKAKEFFEYGNIEAGLTNMLIAWNKTTMC